MFASRTKRHLLVVAIIVILLVALRIWIQSSNRSAKDLGYTDIQPHEALTMASQTEAVIILDVREQYEYADSHVPGSILIPLQDLYNGGYQELDKDKAILVICRSGRRSAQASEFLARQGFSHVYNIVGGILEWPGPTEES